MGAVIPLKNFSLYFFYVILCLQSRVGNSVELPVLQRAGLLPVQWDLSRSDATTFRSEDIEKAFTRSVEETARFELLNSQLVAERWSRPSGLSSLSIEHELNLFLSLTVVLRGDMVHLVARMLGPQLEIWLQESGIVRSSDFSTMAQNEMEGLLSKLVARLVNRLPLDVFVTSIQERYVTLSGGASQGLSVGETLHLSRSFIRSQHPATGEWIDFETRPIGQAIVIEVRKEVAVAEITALNQRDSLKVGDGVRSENLASRTRFDGVVESTNRGKTELLIPPATRPPNKVRSAPMEKKKIVNFGKTKSPAPAIPEEPRATNSFAEKGVFTLGQGSWDFDGPKNSKSEFNFFIPVTNVKAMFTRSLVSKIKYDFGGGLKWGQTKNDGSYFGYHGETKLYWRDKFKIIGDEPLLSHWRGGVSGNLSGFAVNGETFGGGDMLVIDFFAGIAGALQVAEESYPFEYELDLLIRPITIGRIGYDGKQRSARSSTGWALNLAVIESSEPSSLEWGGGFYYGNHYILDSTGNETLLNKFHLNFLTRWRF